MSFQLKSMLEKQKFLPILTEIDFDYKNKLQHI